MKTYRTYLVAVCATGMDAVADFLHASPKGPGEDDNAIDCWWLAEDDRGEYAADMEYDSAIFVPSGSQSDMESLRDQYIEANQDRFAEEGWPWHPMSEGPWSPETQRRREPASEPEPTPIPEPAPESAAAAVAEVFALMTARKVSLADLELYGFIENRETACEEPEEGDLIVPVDEAFNTLVADGFNLWGDRYSASHYYDATNDYVIDALEKRGLLKGGDEA